MFSVLSRNFYCEGAYKYIKTWKPLGAYFRPDVKLKLRGRGETNEEQKGGLVARGGDEKKKKETK